MPSKWSKIGTKRQTQSTRSVLAATLPDLASATILRLADIRYVASELVVPLPPGPYTSASRDTLIQAFELSYLEAFTRTPPTKQVEIINVRVSARSDVQGTARPLRAHDGPSGPASKGNRAVYFSEFQDFHMTRVYDRYALTAGQTFEGPAIVEERESTLVIGPGGSFEQLASGNIIVTVR